MVDGGGGRPDPVACAGLLLRSFQRLVAIEPGFDPSHLLDPARLAAMAEQPEKGRFFFTLTASRVLRTPAGIDAHGAGRSSRWLWRHGFPSGVPAAVFLIEGKPLGPDEQRPAPNSAR